MRKDLLAGLLVAPMILLTTLTLFSQTTVTVTDCNLNGWVKDQRGTTKIKFLNGPSVPPLGKGSFQIYAPDARSNVGRIRNGQYSGVLVSAITELSFSTFIETRASTVNPYSDAPFVVLQVDANGDNIAEFHLVFDPSSQTQPFVQHNFPDQGTTQLGVWQNWDMYHGGWFDGADDPQHGFPLFSLAAFVAQHPTARILNDATQGGAAIRVSGGGPVSSGNFLGEVDNFRIGINGVTTIYDFEFTTANAGPDKNVVYGYGSNCTTLSGSAAGGVAPYTYSWSPAGDAGNNSSTTVCPTDTTMYTLTVTDKNGCIRTDDVVVNVNDVRCGSKMDKVQVCHKGQEICVARESVAAHLNHGDVLGHCPQSAATTSRTFSSEELAAKENLLKVYSYPNPFVNSTTIQYVLPTDGKVIIKIYDISGKEVAALVNSDRKAGLYKHNFTRGNLLPGTYYARITLLSGKSISQTQKLLVLSR
jgi:hypothetical protein